MNKIIILIAAIVLIVGGFFLFMGNQTDYTKAVDDEILVLEEELEVIDQMISTGTLTPEEATAARASIVAKLDAINTAVTTTQTAKLTEAQRLSLLASLSRFNKALQDYQSTILIVEQEATKDPRNGGGGKSISTSLEATIGSIQEFSENIVDYFEESVPEEDLEALDESEVDLSSSSTSQTGTTTETDPAMDTTVESDTEAGLDMDTSTEATTTVSSS